MKRSRPVNSCDSVVYYCTYLYPDPGFQVRTQYGSTTNQAVPTLFSEAGVCLLFGQHARAGQVIGGFVGWCVSGMSVGLVGCPGYHERALAGWAAGGRGLVGVRRRGGGLQYVGLAADTCVWLYRHALGHLQCNPQTLHSLHQRNDNRNVPTNEPARPTNSHNIK